MIAVMWFHSHFGTSASCSYTAKAQTTMSELEAIVPNVPKHVCKCGQCQKCEETNIERAFLLRDAVVSAVAWHKTERLQSIVRVLLNFEPTNAALAVTGLGRLLGDAEVWVDMDIPSHKVLAAVKEKWKVWHVPRPLGMTGHRVGVR